MGNVKRGEIYLMDFPDGIGSEQKHVRPAVIVSNHKGNEHSEIVTVVPITSQIKKVKQPTHVLVRHMKALDRNSVVLCEQIGSFSKLRLIKLLGRFNRKTMLKIDEAIRVALSKDI